MTEEEQDGNPILGFIALSILFFAIIFFVADYNYGLRCKAKAAFSSDLYCANMYSSNLTYDFGHDWQVRSHSADAKAAAEAEKALAEYELQKALDEAAAKKCYDEGYSINESYDIIADYNLTCPKLAYINDHFVDKVDQKEGGYIKGSYSGFLSHGSIDGRSYQYVVTHVSATGQLVEHIEYHVNCRNETSGLIMDDYTEAEFVMYYIDYCIGRSA